MSDPFERAALREELEVRGGQARLARNGFVIHLAVYLAVNLLLFVIWAVTRSDQPWFVYPLLGWGVGITAHGAAVKLYAARE